METIQKASGGGLLSKQVSANARDHHGAVKTKIGVNPCGLVWKDGYEVKKGCRIRRLISPFIILNTSKNVDIKNISKFTEKGYITHSQSGDLGVGGRKKTYFLFYTILILFFSFFFWGGTSFCVYIAFFIILKIIKIYK